MKIGLKNRVQIGNLTVKNYTKGSETTFERLRVWKIRIHLYLIIYVKINVLSILLGSEL